MVPVKLYAYAGVLVLLALGAGGLYWKGKTAGEARGEAVAQAALRERDTALASLRASQAASEGYANELEELRSNPGPDPVVRVCPKPKPVPVPGPTAGTDGPAPAAGDVPEEPGRDIGPALAREAERADRLAAQLRALQEWINGVRGAGSSDR
jgi:hypothetical protein